MVQIELTQAMQARLANIARHDGISLDRATLVAIEQFVQDREDSIDADEIMARDEPLIPWAEAKRTLGLDR
jgi:predicted DNA-binding protein